MSTHPYLLEERARFPIGTVLRPNVSNDYVRSRIGQGVWGASVEYALNRELRDTMGMVIGHDEKPDEERDDCFTMVLVIVFPQGVFEYSSWDFVDVIKP